jgi:MerR family transcriptional regulator/heat shock protein HspR
MLTDTGGYQLFSLAHKRKLSEEGVNLVGIKRILELETEVEHLRAQLEALLEQHRPTEYLPVQTFGGTALAVYRSSRTR